MEKAKILVVDDDKAFALALKVQLKRWDYEVKTAGNGIEALKALEEELFDLVISDRSMPGMNGLELLYAVKENMGDLPFIIMTAYGTIDEAVTSIKKGADDYFQKPYKPDELKATIERSLEYSRLSRENRELKDHQCNLHSFQNIVTKSEAMKKALQLAEKVTASPNTTIALFGESGTGKEVLAKAIHAREGKLESRFIAVNCAAIPANLLESELFGHVKGAFTGADRDKEGKFDLAQKGTILLDEIGDMPPDLQTKLLRVLEERCYERVGSAKKIKADLRVVAATHRNLQELIGKGKFREDLYHRINTFPITISPLRERKADIPLLVEHFLDMFRNEMGKNVSALSKNAMELICNHDWPGNVRELKNCLERAVILADHVIESEHLSIGVKGDSPGGSQMVHIDLRMPSKTFSLETAVDNILDIALERCDNNKSRAAEFLGVDRKMFYRRKT